MALETDHIGERFGRLVVLSSAGIRKKTKLWVCRCDCGVEKVVGVGNVMRGLTKSCGCLRKETASRLGALRQRVGFSVHVGKRFGRLVVLSPAGMRKKSMLWLCRCDCGKERVAYATDIRRGRAKSCGCLKRTPQKHGHAKKGAHTRAYQTWRHMKDRCLNPRNKRFFDYGGRGIKVCDRWLNSFENFLADMGERPEGKTLDRYPDNNGNYEPGNCRWATPLQQQQNRRRYRKSTNKIQENGNGIRLR